MKVMIYSRISKKVPALQHMNRLFFTTLQFANSSTPSMCIYLLHVLLIECVTNFMHVKALLYFCHLPIDKPFTVYV